MTEDHHTNRDWDADRVQERKCQCCPVVEVIPAAGAELAEVHKDVSSVLVDSEAVEDSQNICTRLRVNEEYHQERPACAVLLGNCEFDSVHQHQAADLVAWHAAIRGSALAVYVTLEGSLDLRGGNVRVDDIFGLLFFLPPSISVLMLVRSSDCALSFFPARLCDLVDDDIADVLLALVLSV